MTRQPAWLRHGPTFLAVLLTLLLTAFYLTKTATLAVPIRIHLAGLSAAAENRVSIRFTTDRQQTLQGQRLLNTSYWFVDFHWIRRIQVVIPEEFSRLDNLTVTIGLNKPRLFEADELRQIAVDGTGVVVELPRGVGIASSLPWIDNSILNWPGDVSYVRAIGQTALLPCVLIVLFGVWFRSSHAPHLPFSPSPLLPISPSPLLPISPSPLLPSSSASWIGLTFLVGCFVFLEVNDPYYFTQCDTINEDLPLILVGCRSYWRGEFPNYNPYNSLGTPLAGTGLGSLTYPPMVFSYAIARHVLLNENATAEVFVILHLTVGFLLMCRLAGKIGLGALAANLTSLSFVLSGAALVMGRSWFNFTPIMVWMPVVFLGLLKLRDGPASWGWVLGMGLALSMPFHVGFTQLAIYIAGFFCLGVLFLAWSGSLPWKKARLALPALVVGAGLALPLVLQQWLLARGAERFEVPDQGIAMGLPALLLPYPLVRVQVPARWGNENLQLMGHVYFFGGVLAWLFFYQAVGLLFFRPRRREDWAVHLWTVFGLIALWLSLGDFGGLWTLLKWLPIVDRVNRHPLRLVPFLVFFATLSGGLALDRLLQSDANPNRKPWRQRKFVITAVAVALLLWHVSQCRTAFKVVDYRPYPPLPADLQALFWKDGQATGRVLSWGRYSHNESWALQLPRNLAAVYEVPSLDGQNPLLDGGPLPVFVQEEVLRRKRAALQAYGVRWHLRQSPQNFTPDGSVLSHTWQTDVQSQQDRLGPFRQFTPVTQNELVIVGELQSAAPLAFIDDETAAVPVQAAGTLGLLGSPSGEGGVIAASAIFNAKAADVAARDSRRLDLWMHGWGLEVDVTPLRSDQRVVVNFLRWPGMRAFVDGEEVRFLNDDWKRIAVRVGAGHQRLTIRYEPPWSQGLLYGLAAVVVGLALTWFFVGRRSRILNT